MPLIDAGMRIDPPPSKPTAMGTYKTNNFFNSGNVHEHSLTNPVATATAEPDEDPPE